MSDGATESVGRVAVIVIRAAFMHSYLSINTANLTIYFKVLISGYEPIETKLRSTYMRVSLYVVS